MSVIIPATIAKLLAYTDAGLLAAERFVALVRVMKEENRDLTDEELAAEDITRDSTHSAIQDAIERKRQREGGGSDD